MPSVIITISPEGETTVEAQGYQGATCKDATRAIESALGTTTNDVKKPEFTQTAAKTTRKATQ